MQIRSELNALSANMRAAVPTWNGGERIKIGNVDSTITKLSQDVLAKTEQYFSEENSVRGCLETLHTLETSVKGLAGQLPTAQGSRLVTDCFQSSHMAG
jgi:hypothetical protein